MDKRLINSEPKSLKADVLLLESQLLFRRLIIDPSSFDKDSFINYLTDYITKYNRINYSSLSSLIYSNEEKTYLTLYIIVSFPTRAKALIDKCRSRHYN